MLAGKEVVVHGDGQSLWTLTHTRDFAVGLVGLLGNPAAIGEAVQITGDEALTWESIHRIVAACLGVEPAIVHVPSDFIAAVDPEIGQHFLGDKTYSALFDCSKLKRLVPEFRTTIPFQQGIRESIEWLRADPSRQTINAEIDAIIEKVLAAWKRGMKAALG
jgi:nucleoside-diphosphate-sugar epimerase